MRKRVSDSEEPVTRRKPATTSEGRESQLVSLAEDLAEKQLIDGTASAQVISHFLKLGSSREKLEQARIRHENELLAVKIQAVADAKQTEELYKNAIAAMRSYAGYDNPESDDGYA